MGLIGSIFPFNLPGPQFLAWYIGLVVALLIAIGVLRRRSEGGRLPKLGTDDPYLIAHLRGGARSAVRLATFSLIDRGLLKLDANDRALAASAAAEKVVRRRLEQRVLRYFDRRSEIKAVNDSSLPEIAEAEYRGKLEALRLLPDAETRRRRWQRAAVGAGLLLAIGGTKLAVALAAGRGNIWFLIIVSVIALILLYRTTRSPRTALGDKVLKDLQTLFYNLRRRVDSIRPGGRTTDAVVAAAVFGLSILPTAHFPYISELRPQQSSSSDGDGVEFSSDGGGDGGSGCGGCGGGGCGGGD
jgi:uncharacterized protein (TIGR04222 family)